MRRQVTGVLVAAAVLFALVAPCVAPAFEAALAGDSAAALDGIAAYSIALAPTWWADGSFLALPTGTVASATLALLSSALAFAAMATPRRGDDGGVLGNARVRTGREAIAGSDTWDGRSEPAVRGYVYGFSHDRYLFESGSPHAVVVGQTGSGKTRFQNIPTLDLLTFGGNGQSVIVSDAKGEVVELCGDALAARGYRVLTLDLQRPRRSDRYNPIKLVVDRAAADDVQGAQQAAEDVAAAIVPAEGDGQSSHWVNSARGLLAAAVLYVAFSEDCPEEAKHMATVCRVIDEGTEGTGAEPAEPLKEAFRALPAGHPARAMASQFLSSGGNELRSVLSTLKVRLRPFSSESIAWLTSASDIDPTDVLTGKTALFLHVMDEGSPYNALFAILFSQVYQSVYIVADGAGGRLPRDLAILGDEWGNLPKVECLPSLLSLGRSYGLHWYGSFQTLAQLNKYGERDGRRKVLANCGVKVALKLGEAEDRQYFSELAGKTTRHTRGTSDSRGRGRSVSTSFSEHADDVIHQWEWLEMSPARDGAIVVKQAENSTSPLHAGVFRVPLTDCTNTPTKAHFDLGTREHEAKRRVAYQRGLDARGADRSGSVSTWCPAWPPSEADGSDVGGWDGMALD